MTRGVGQFETPVNVSSGGGVSNEESVIFRTVTVAAAGTPQQGPSISVPDGQYLVVVFRSTQAQDGRKGYIGATEAYAKNAEFRTELVVGGIRRFKITNMNLLWFDSSVNGGIFELFVEQ